MKLLFGIVVAIITLKWWPSIPSSGVVITTLLILIALRRYVSEIVIGAAIGCLIATGAVAVFQHKTDTALTVDLNTTIAGKVGSLFTKENGQTSVIFDVDTVNGRKLTVFETFRARLYWRSELPVKQGQHWSVTARLREPYGRVNEAGFDAETYFLSRHIHSKGSVRTANVLNERVSVRQQLYDTVYDDVNHLGSARFLIALAFGERSLLSSEDWQQLRDSGLAHLLAISGLHIGLAFFFGYTVARYVFPLIVKRDTHLWVPLMMGLVAACLYAWMAGFSLTTQRALMALLVVSLIRQSGFSVSPFNTFFLVLAAVLAFDPLSIFSASFWLSFGAVYALCIMALFRPSAPIEESAMQKVARYIKSLLIMQFVLMIGMLPLMWTWFGGVSLTALFFNVLAVPLISLITVPLILLGLMLTPLGASSFVWQAADLSLQPLIGLLGMASFGWLETQGPSILFPIVVVFLSLMLWLVGVRTIPITAGVVSLALLTWKSAPSDTSAWRVDVFDVGHGLAMLIEKEGRAVMYDTGAAWASGSIAASVIAPVLAKRGSKLDGLILSHGDNDHSGGEDWVIKHLMPEWVRSSENDIGHLPCLRGNHWRWQQLEFEVLYPLTLSERAKNPSSCVIKVSDGTHAVLLTGDLPKAQEAYLLAQHDDLSADVVIVPHHGSKTSSSEAFIDHVNPLAAIASTGRYTPWNLPHPDIVSRYKSRGIEWFETGYDGQVSAQFSDKGWRVLSQRNDTEPFWYRKKFGAPKRKE
ncbi:DNA internalization-related competence protein ComEC/Rec2 [Enterovibrio baiacu]|uniref:DNA internalization-related competence protein ComEC/Rec2 n=1 Tax=Enterovibrio baiacu TaxID=2491023 RepID=UPI00101384FB|nr:DNA internalization-related competence protein ComEC/Rec2 [Enterovibrio baiacu]MBE1274251.1 DNA internalization-related competence protein ComEC/Rec2 [Enterovibrio baiacu]